MWDKETLIVPIIIGALGSIPNDLECNLKNRYIIQLGTSQKSILSEKYYPLNNKDQKIIGGWEKEKREKEGGGERGKKWGNQQLVVSKHFFVLS